MVYHGKGRLGNLRLSRQRKRPLPPHLSAYYPDFEPVVLDLNHFNPRKLRPKGYHFLASALLALKYSRDENYLAQNFVDIVAFESSDDPKNRYKVVALLHYLALLLNVTKEKFQTMVSTLPSQQAKVAKSAFEDILDAGRVEGLAKGRTDTLREKNLRLIRLHPEWSDAYIAELIGEEVAWVAEIRRLA